MGDPKQGEGEGKPQDVVVSRLRMQPRQTGAGWKAPGATSLRKLNR